MREIDKYFKDQTDKISFIEINNPNYKALDVNLPYPINTQALIEGVKEEEFFNSISYKHIIDGIIELLAIDPEFEHKDSYLTTIKKVVESPEKYSVSNGIDLLSKKDENYILYFRFPYVSGFNDPFCNYNYARSLYYIYEKEEKEFFRSEAISILEEIIDKDEDFPLSYYELGIIYSKEENYNKAYLYFEKAIERVDDDLVKEEIREYMRNIYPSVLLERAIEKLNKGRLDESLELLNEAKLISDTAVVNYYIGVVHEAQGRVDLGIDYYKESLEKGGNFRELYQDLAIAYYKMSEPLLAIDILNEGLKKHIEDSHLLYNRMVIFISLDQFNLAKEDMDTILQYGDVPEEILNNIRIIKDQYNL